MKFKNILTLTGLAVLVYVLLKYIIPAIFSIAITLFWIVIYAAAIIVVFGILFYIFGKVSRKRR
ncbi:MAG TPA: hypothetical protein PLA54_11505 [Spirochaetota bacterium]|jgi:hypothetical protein|nr:hypothetical protein [Spirochaetota bacterium]MBP9023944.1 hypothetical protein [Spirochaetota bacterium]HOU85303.1 hypothetical protein [Spirochaetota bacterium]HQE59803.1 hypothetical protein [Spirochaetota bacterium]